MIATFLSVISERRLVFSKLPGIAWGKFFL